MSFNLTIQDYPHYTYKDYEIWEGDWELIKGIAYAMAPAPIWQHQDFGFSFIQHFKMRSRKERNAPVKSYINLTESLSTIPLFVRM